MGDEFLSLVFSAPAPRLSTTQGLGDGFCRLTFWRLAIWTHSLSPRFKDSPMMGFAITCSRLATQPITSSAHQPTAPGVRRRRRGNTPLCSSRQIVHRLRPVISVTSRSRRMRRCCVPLSDSSDFMFPPMTRCDIACCFFISYGNTKKSTLGNKMQEIVRPRIKTLMDSWEKSQQS